MYIKAIVKKINYEENDVSVQLQGVEGFYLKAETFKKEIKSINISTIGDRNVFVDGTGKISSEKFDDPITVKKEMINIIEKAFSDSRACIFEIKDKKILSIEKCD